jgi:beta-glucosidase
VQPVSEDDPTPVRLTDVAERAGVSRSTASRVINRSPSVSGAARDSVWQAVRELGYHADETARALARRRPGDGERSAPYAASDPPAGSPPLETIPRDFFWGAATSAHQYDGGNVASDFWELEQSAPGLFAEPSGDAIDSRNRWSDDIELAAALGYSAYRLSIEWARIEPARGQYSLAEREHYRAVIRRCRDHGLEPLITLQHISHPAWFSRAGGWLALESADWFAEYVAFIAPILDDVRYVATINEPNIVATLGEMGELLRASDTRAAYVAISERLPDSPGGLLGAATHRTPDDRVVAGLIRAHEAARAVLRQRTSCLVGWTVAMMGFESRPGFEREWAEASRVWEDRFLEVARDDDWIGVHSFSAELVGPDGPEGAPEGARTTQLGWSFRPDSVGIALRRASAVAPGVPLIVTENGVATADDDERLEYLQGATAAVAEALLDGIDVRGYLHWTFIDNYEWASGYAVTFGLVAVDRETFVRTPKPSAYWLGALARASRRASSPA